MYIYSPELFYSVGKYMASKACFEKQNEFHFKRSTDNTYM